MQRWWQWGTAPAVRAGQCDDEQRLTATRSRASDPLAATEMMPWCCRSATLSLPPSLPPSLSPSLSPCTPHRLSAPLACDSGFTS